MQTAILSALGVIVGAILQYIFTRYLEQLRHRREFRTKAYIDYLSHVSDQANLGYDRQSNEAMALRARAADAKCRICLYGSSKTIEAFAKFERLGATLSTDEGREAFVNMVVIMRGNSINDTNIESEDMRLVLFGQHPKPR